MTVYDGVMGLIVLWTIVHGFWRGAAWQVAPIASLVLGYMVAMPMSVTTAQYFGPPPLNRLFALVTIYILVAMVVYLLVRSFREGIDKAKLTEFDRHLGAILGGLKGVMVTLATTCALLIYFPMAREVILQSESSSIAAKLISQIHSILPQAMHAIVDPYLRRLDEQLPIDLDETDDGFLGSGSGAKSLPNLTPPSKPPAADDSSLYHLDPTPSAAADEFQPPVRRQFRSIPDPQESTQFLEPTPTAQRPVVKSAQEDDPFESADPDRAISPPR